MAKDHSSTKRSKPDKQNSVANAPSETKDSLPSAHKISTACSKLDVSRSTIYRMAKAGQLELIRVGKGATRVTDASLRTALGLRSAA